MKDVAVIGAGLAGLNCALTLQRAGLDVIVLEASDAAGGRVRTDKVDGFLLDRGFQVLLTAYPEAQSVLDYNALNLQNLKPGALVWRRGRFHHFADPFRDPIAALKLVLDPVVTLGDKLRVARLRSHVMRGPIANLFEQAETTTRTGLEHFGFSGKIIESFFQPFFGGVFLEHDLATSSRFFEFLFRMFSTGAVALPAAGMEAIPQQLAARLQPETLQLKTRIDRLTAVKQAFQLSGDAVPAIASRFVVIATEEPETRRLLQTLGAPEPPSMPRTWNSTTAFYFAAPDLPSAEPILMLNGEGRAAGPVNNAVVLSSVAKSYAPAGSHLVSASVIGQAPASQHELLTLETAVRRHLERWFGTRVSSWHSLGARPIRHALPLQATARWEISTSETAVKGIFLCGDFLETASLQGSLVSGRRAAQALLHANSA